MNELVKLANRVKSLNTDNLIRVLSEDISFTNLIIELNTKKQLFEKGIDSKGRKLSDIGGNYSPFTLDLHPEKIADRVTLFDTGDFYNSFKVFYDSGNLEISADTIKDTTNLITEWGADILGLTEESLTILREKALTIILPYVRKQLLI